MKHLKAMAAMGLALCLALTSCSSGSGAGTTAAAGGTTAAAGETTAAAEGGSAAEGGEAQAGGTLRVGQPSAPVNLNIWTHNDQAAYAIMALVCPFPLQINEEGIKENYLVKEVTNNEDATEFTVTFRDDLFWNDGTPFSSEDVKFTCDYMLEHKLSYAPSFLSLVESCEIKDEHTVVYHLSASNVNFYNSAGYWIPIMPKAEFENETDPMNHTYSGMGYGPFYVADYVQGEYCVLKKNPYFTMANDGKGALLDEIVFSVYSDENAVILALQNGEIDTASNFITVAAQNQLQNNASFDLLSVQSLGYGFISFCQNNTILQDANLRKAMAMAMDRNAICTVAYQGGAEPMLHPISQVWADFVKSDIQQPAFDVDGANALLDQSGYTDTNGDGIRENSDGTPLQFTMTYRNTLANVDSIMEILRSDFQKIGIGLDLSPVDATTFTANVTQGHDYDLSYALWATIDDVDTTIYTIYGIGQQLNYMDFNDQEMDDLLMKSKTTMDRNERIAIMDEWQKLFIEKLPTVNLLVATNVYPVNTEKFGGWGIVPGVSGPLTVTKMVNVYAK
ncbi:ABC transporter substrate-binding protein [Hominifimenecus sp. rT4P-3]|uniref:ABC transporter substrate-binding protein n=1 Tax=Hominifimenecus sp. rT4P-3 TaxID=3242979 RepID=UPI003DA5A2FF